MAEGYRGADSAQSLPISVKSRAWGEKGDGNRGSI